MVHSPHYLAPFAIAFSTSVANLLGQLAGSSTISIGEALTVFVFVGTLVVYLAKKLQKIEDDLEHLQEQSNAMKEQIDSYTKKSD